RVALERKADSARHERAEALSSRTGEVDSNRVVRQTRCAVASRHFAAEHRADGAIDVANRKTHFDGLTVVQRILRQFDKEIVQRPLDSVILRLHATFLTLRSDCR